MENLHLNHRLNPTDDHAPIFSTHHPRISWRINPRNHMIIHFEFDWLHLYYIILDPKTFSGDFILYLDISWNHANSFNFISVVMCNLWQNLWLVEDGQYLVKEQAPQKIVIAYSKCRICKRPIDSCEMSGE